uniref:Uncharacterized protein n=1 Tax=Panagrolaimus davidi TaxID=227884 RepID=A0A914PDD9_9BILA
MVKNLPGYLRCGIKCMIVAGVVIGLKNPPEWVWKFISNVMKPDLLKLKAGIIYVCKNGTKILIKATVSDLILDQIAFKMVYKFSGHSAYGFGCPTCEVFPYYEEHGMRWPITEGKLREEADGRGTAIVPSAFSEIAHFSKMRLDGLHIIDEGLLKSLLHYLFNKLKKMESIRKEVSRCMLVHGSCCYAYTKGLASLNAHELRLLFAVSVPILSVGTVPTSLRTTVQISYLFWLLCRLLYCKFLNKNIIQEIAPVFMELGKIMESHFGNLFKTIKAHRFFAHGGEELLKWGTPADYSASACESVNRLLKLLYNAYNTRGFDRTLIHKHLEGVMSEIKMEDMVERMNIDPSTYRDIYASSPKDKSAKSTPYKGVLLPEMEENDLVFHSIARHGFTYRFNPSTEKYAYFNSKSKCL